MRRKGSGDNVPLQTEHFRLQRPPLPSEARVAQESFGTLSVQPLTALSICRAR